MNAAEVRENDLGYIGKSSESNFIEGAVPDVFPSIYDEQINIVVLRRSLTEQVKQYCQELVDQHPNFQLRSVINNERAIESLKSLLPELEGKSRFVQDLALLLDMYSCLFDLEEVGLRLQVLDRAMCPRFHTDKLGCRLVTTYKGPGSEWLPNDVLDRTKLGAGNQGLSDDVSGLYTDDESIQQVNEGDVLLLKGDGWYGNEGAGAVHRSPAVSASEKRVVVTMDFA